MANRKKNNAEALPFVGELGVRVRLYDRILKNGTDGCWSWLGKKDKYGYGTITVKGCKMTAHRVSYMIHCGSVPTGLCVCHHCDNRQCTNPEHLFVGTHYDNAMDRHRKGRTKCAHGERVGGAKLTEDKVSIIRDFLKTNHGLSMKEIAGLWGVCPMTICLLANNKIWKHVI